MNDKSRLLIVDDEPDITRVLGTFLGTQGYSVRTAGDGAIALKVMREWSPDLIITDLSMPKMGGIAFCREVRKSSSVPIVVLSVREEESTKVEALNSGADDYVTKPFGMDELLARVRAALRRSKQSDHLMTRFEAGDFRIDQEAHTVHVKGREVRLTPKEFQLLTYLIRNSGRVLTPRTLLAEVWERTYTEQLDNVRALIRQLRKKIEPNPSSPRYLKTEPWVGYRLPRRLTLSHTSHNFSTNLSRLCALIYAGRARASWSLLSPTGCGRKGDRAMTVSFSKLKLALVIGVSLALIGVTYAAIVHERWDGTSNHIGLWNGPAALTARTLKTPVGETTGTWHYHPGYVYNVVRQGTITIEDGCGSVQSFSAGQAFETSKGRVHRA